jgi:hypothetical protein
MRIPSLFGFFFSGTAIVALLAGCSAGGSQIPTANAPVTPLSQSIRNVRSSPARMLLSNVSQSHQSDFVDVAAVNAPHGNQTIVSDSNTNTVSVYGADGRRHALLSSGLSQPEGITTDAAENLYVANAQLHNVVVYSKPYRSIGLTLDDPNEYPTDVAVSNVGVVGVMNIQSTAGTGGAVVIYAKGSTSACATITDPNWSGMYFGAFDASGNLFLDGFDRNGNTLVGEISGGCNATSIATLSTGVIIYLVGGVQVSNGNILIEDQVGPGGPLGTNTPTIYTFAPPAGGSLGQPLATTTLSAGGNWLPVTFAIVKDGERIWIAHSGIAAGRVEYSYPRGLLVKSFDDSRYVTPIGIAVNPAAIPR